MNDNLGLVIRGVRHMESYGLINYKSTLIFAFLSHYLYAKDPISLTIAE